VLAFQTSAALAYAFGMAVTGTIIITTLLLFYVARTQWRWPLWLVLLVSGPILVLEGLFLAANLTKLAHGAWLPLLIAVVIFTVFTTWQRGRQLVTARREAAEGPLRGFVDDLHEQRLPVLRVPGTAVFLNRGRTTAPLAMRSNAEHNHVLHEGVVIVAVETVPVPVVRPEELAVVDDLGYTDDGITHVIISVGYMQQADVPGVLAALPAESFESTINLDNASYFLSTIDLGTGDGDQRTTEQDSEMAGWRRRLFIATAALTADAAEYFNLPRDRTVIIGSRIRI
jgi:KUP system potassium uptake protein